MEGEIVSGAGVSNNTIPFKNYQSIDSSHRYNKTQKGIVDCIVNSNSKVIIVNAPTGVGKSLIAMMSASNMNIKHTNYICSTKALQSQLVDDFPEAMVLRGRGNYKCNKYSWLKADTCLEKCEEYKARQIPCEYYDQKLAVISAQYRVLNTAYLLNEANYVGCFGAKTKTNSDGHELTRRQELIIIDEADTLESNFLNFVGLKITNKNIDKFNLDAPKYVTKVEAWIDWAQENIVRMSSLYPQKTAMEALDKEYIHARRFILNLERFLEMVDETWLFDKNEKSWTFKPVWLNRSITETYLWNHSEKFILVSATLPKKEVMCRTLCLKPEEVTYIDVGSPYPIENRYVYYNPITEMSSKNEDNWYMVIDEMDKDILEFYPNVKGIIHSVSYKLRDKIMEQCTQATRKRLITHDSNNKEKQLEVFKNSNDPLIFISPSSERGISLDGDLARFIMWPKVPFLNLGDKQVKARVYSGRHGSDWYSSEAMQAIVQGAGRGVRGIGDWCETRVYDKQFGRLMKFAPKWFRDAIILK